MANETKQLNKTNSGLSTTVMLRYLRIAPRKVRLVAHMIKHLPVNEAQAQLLVHSRRAAEPILKLLKSGIESAKNKKMNLDKLVISEIRVDKGPMLKRWMPRAQGRATPIHKDTSHIILTLQEKELKEGKNQRFIIEVKKIKKSDKHDKHSHTHAHDQEDGEGKKIKASQEKELETREEIKKESKTKDKGFVQKMFRRKSV